MLRLSFCALRVFCFVFLTTSGCRFSLFCLVVFSCFDSLVCVCMCVCVCVCVYGCRLKHLPFLTDVGCFADGLALDCVRCGDFSLVCFGSMEWKNDSDRMLQNVNSSGFCLHKFFFRIIRTVFVHRVCVKLDSICEHRLLTAWNDLLGRSHHLHRPVYLLGFRTIGTIFGLICFNSFRRVNFRHSNLRNTFTAQMASLAHCVYVCVCV